MDPRVKPVGDDEWAWRSMGTVAACALVQRETELFLPTPTFDHVVVNARDRLDEAQTAYQRLGFTLTPRGYHSLGSTNHLAIFGTDYLELLGLPAAEMRPDVASDPIGLNGLVFGTEDSAGVYAALAASGVPATPPNQFTRPVELGDGTSRDATFRTVHIQPAEGRPGRLYFCHHFTRDLVWRDEWRQHANGAVGIVRAVIASSDPSILGALFARMFGPAAVRPVEGGVRLAVGAMAIEVLDPAAVARQIGDAAEDAAGRHHYMAALTLRTRGLDLVRSALDHGGVTALVEPGRVLVPAASGMGCPLEFVP